MAGITSGSSLVPETGGTVATEAFQNKVADFRGVVDRAEEALVPGFILLSGGITAPASRTNPQISQTQKALKGALPKLHLLQVGEAHRRLVNRHQPLAQAQAAVRDQIPAVFVIEPVEGGGLPEVAKRKPAIAKPSAILIQKSRRGGTPAAILRKKFGGERPP